jgi:NADPH-dependent 2,4-dienoyl-CoA reductase/sulfur reductase-like enzyme
MSQHLFSTHCNGKPVVVLMGWDRPLQGFFLVVEEDDEKSDGYVYTNMDDPALAPWMGLPPTIDPFLAKLQELGITVPSCMVEEIRSDAARNVGNRYVTYDESGTITN